MQEQNLNKAREDFRQATHSAWRRRIWTKLTGRRNDLLPFEDVRRSLGFDGQRYRGLQPVPLDRIVGSLDRNHDFDRVFMPTQVHSRSKWMSVDAAYMMGTVLPPISLYKVGDAYFVVDGHHRVSVARQKQQTFIDAEVIEVQSRVPVTENLALDDLDVLAAYRGFLEQTKLDVLRPDQNVRLTMPGDYMRMLDHIRMHKYFVEVEQSRELSWEEAVAHWYDHVYLPVIETIRRKNLLRGFSNLTEGDLYFWVIEHAYYLSQRLGQSLAPWEVANDFSERFGRQPRYVARRIVQRIVSLIIPNELESGPPAGTWRAERVQTRASEHFFRDILVALTGAETGWLALTQAAEFARREGGVLRGVHIITADGPEAEAYGQAVLQEFETRARALGVPFTSRLARNDDVAQEIVDRARWADLVIINQRRVHGRIEERPLGTIFQSVASRAACPLLAVPGAQVTPLRRVLLAYDGSPKAREALFAFRHLVTCWGLEGAIVTVEGAGADRETLAWAQRYMQESGGAPVQTHFETGAVDEVILRLMSDEGHDLLLLGGFGYQPLLKAVLGSTVDRVLRLAWFPVLICR